MRIVLGGDVMLGRLIDLQFLAHGRSPFAFIADRLQAADLACANLECAITARLTRYQGPPKAFYFKARPVAARILAEAGIGLVTLANNHALDAGPDGLRDTLTLLDGQGIAHAGAGLDLAGASRPGVVDLKSGSVGVLAYCDHQEDFAATAGRAGIRYLPMEEPDPAIAVLEADIERSRGLVDVLVVGMHWQPNWAPVVQANYRRIAHACIAAGARVVWGHSPHHFQGVEILERGAILYSTGDFIDDYAVDPVFENDRQLLFAVEVGPSGAPRVEAFPLEIEGGHARPADTSAARWIEGAFRHACEAVGSVVDNAGDRLVVRRMSPAGRRSPSRGGPLAGAPGTGVAKRFEGPTGMPGSSELVDESLQHEVLEALQFDPAVPAADVGVRVKDRVVTLLGTVASSEARHAAEDATRKVRGASAIVNALEVVTPGPVVRTDEDVARDILAAFERDENVPAQELRVSVDRGRVVLEGEVVAAHQRQAAEEAVRSIPDVREIANRITIPARPLPSARGPCPE